MDPVPENANTEPILLDGECPPGRQTASVRTREHSPEILRKSSRILNRVHEDVTFVEQSKLLGENKERKETIQRNDRKKKT